MKKIANRYFYKVNEKTGQPIAGTLAKYNVKPTTGKWKEVNSDVCCIVDTPECPDACVDFNIFRTPEIIDNYIVYFEHWNGTGWDILLTLGDDDVFSTPFVVDPEEITSNYRFRFEGVDSFAGDMTPVLLNNLPITSNIAFEEDPDNPDTFVIPFTNVTEYQSDFNICNKDAVISMENILGNFTAITYEACVGGTTVDSVDIYDVSNNLLQHIDLNILTSGTLNELIGSKDQITKMIFHTTIGSSSDTTINVCITDDVGGCSFGIFTGNPIGDLTMDNLVFAEDAIITIDILCDGSGCPCAGG